MTSRINTNEQRAIVITALRHALPYLRVYKHKVFVLKAGGDAFVSAETTRALMEQVGILHQVGIRGVLVHGGGPQSTALSKRLGLTTQMVEGRRVTDADTLEVSTMVLNGEINTRIVAMCRALGIPAIGLSGVDGGLIKATKRPLVQVAGRTVDYGFVGDILGLDTSILVKQLDNDLVPIVSPLSADDQGTLLNINADTVAAGIGAGLKAEKLMLCTGAPGILESLDDPRSIVSYTDLAGLARLKAQGSLKEGMLPKAKAIEDAIRGGVRRVHVISYKSQDSILAEVFTNEGTGTLIVENISALSPAEQHG
jgi:acetylglutamate kinase